MLSENQHLSEVSIIIPCKNELNNIKNTVDSMMNSKNQLSFEIIVVNDGSTDGCCDFIDIDRDVYKDLKLILTNNMGVAGARNLGAKEALGKYLFFCDAHITVPDYWLDELIKVLEENSAHAVSPGIKDDIGGGIGYGETWSSNLKCTWLKKPQNNGQEIPIAPGGAFCVKKDVFEAVGGFDKHFELWGKEDEEISLKLWLFGYKIVVNSSVYISHLFRIVNPCGVTSLEIIYNYLYMVYSHFDYENLSKALNIIKTDPNFPQALAKIMLNEDLLKQRKEYFSRRKYDENYFFKKFDIQF